MIHRALHRTDPESLPNARLIKYPYDAPRDDATWAVFRFFDGIRTTDRAQKAGRARIKHLLDLGDYTTFAVNNQGQQQHNQEAATWLGHIGNPAMIDCRQPHAARPSNMDSQAVAIDTLSVRYFVTRR
jgi:hypothetical protein